MNLSFFFLFSFWVFLCQAAYVPVFVMLQLDVMNNNGQLNYPQKLDQQLAQLKSGGVDGVMCDLWWGIVEQKGPKQYNWAGYLQLASMCQKHGLKIQAVASFHKCGTNQADACFIPLPPWVTSVGSSNPDIFYKDKDGHYDDEYLSSGVDDLIFFQGRTPVQIYTDFVVSFVKTFSTFIPGTISELEIGLGPAGELRYPSYQLQYWHFPGIGEFQCYDKYLSSLLSSSASAVGHPEWGVPPSDAGNYNSAPEQTGFFSTSSNVSAPTCNPSNRVDCGFTGINQQQCEAKGCCWQPANNAPWCFSKSSPSLGNFQSPYGQFFLQWYQNTLMNHADKILGNITSVIPQVRPDLQIGKNIQLLGKVSGIHWLWNTPSHAAEATAGYKNDQGQAYLQITKLFAKYNVFFDFTCFEMRDSEQTSGNCRCAPEELVYQTLTAAHSNSIGYAGENALNRYDSTAYATIEYESKRVMVINDFTYLRLGDTLLSQPNWQVFTGFVQNMHNL